MRVPYRIFATIRLEIEFTDGSKHTANIKFSQHATDHYCELFERDAEQWTPDDMRYCWETMSAPHSCPFQDDEGWTYIPSQIRRYRIDNVTIDEVYRVGRKAA